LVHPELISYREQFQRIIDESSALVQGLSEEEFNWRPGAGQWSIEECMAHLVMVGNVELDYIEKAIEEGKNRGLNGAGPFHYSALERYVLRETEPPLRRARQTPRRFTPLHNQPLTGVMPTFFHVQRRFIQQIERADGLDLKRVKVSTPIVPFLKFSLGSTFAQAAAHERRHMLQARRVREKLPRGVPLPATH
jgi:DinB superfamily